MRRSNRESAGVAFGVALIALVGLALASVAQAGGLYVEEYATNSMGTAGAGRTASALDAGTLIHNPAGMTRLEGHQIWAGFTPGVGFIEFDKTDSAVNANGGNGGNQGGSLVPMLGTGYAHKLTDRVSLGTAIFSVSGAALDPSNNWTGQNEVTRLTLLTFAANPGVAIKVTDWLSIAGNALVIYGNLDWKFRGPVAGGTVHIEDADDIAGGGMGSILLEPTEGLRFGLVYQSEVKLKLRGNFDVPVSETSPGLNLDLPLPQAVRFSAYWDATEEIALLFSAGWEDWSTADTVSLGIGGNGAIVPLGFQDTWRIGFGLHYQLNSKWQLRTGYTYDSSALRTQDRISALPIDEQHRLGFGAMHKLSDSTQVGLLFQWLHLGQGKLKTANVRGSYGPNEIFFFGATLNWMTPSWKQTFGRGES
jgi:long-chain fatty acid transport protein